MWMEPEIVRLSCRVAALEEAIARLLDGAIKRRVALSVTEIMAVHEKGMREATASDMIAGDPTKWPAFRGAMAILNEVVSRQHGVLVGVEEFAHLERVLNEQPGNTVACKEDDRLGSEAGSQPPS